MTASVILIKRHESSQLRPASACVEQLAVLCTMYSVHYTCRTAQQFRSVLSTLENVSFRTYMTDKCKRLQSGVERHLTTLLSAKYSTEVCIHTSGKRGYVFLHVLPRDEAWGTSGIVRVIEVYVVENCVIASQFSMELMLSRHRLSVIMHNSEVYVIRYML